ncbi:hypothetical protein ACLB2K_015957 [Fragaria x ananassa]
MLIDGNLEEFDLSSGLKFNGGVNHKSPLPSSQIRSVTLDESMTTERDMNSVVLDSPPSFGDPRVSDNDYSFNQLSEQVFLKLTHESKVEHIFVVGSSGKKFEKTLDFLGLVDKFYYLSDSYDLQLTVGDAVMVSQTLPLVQLTVGDAVMENSFLRAIGHVDLDLPEAPEKATRPPSPAVDPYLNYCESEELPYISSTSYLWYSVPCWHCSSSFAPCAFLAEGTMDNNYTAKLVYSGEGASVSFDHRVSYFDFANSIRDRFPVLGISIVKLSSDFVDMDVCSFDVSASSSESVLSNNMMGSKIIKSIMLDKVRENPNKKAIDIYHEIKSDYEMEVSYRTAWYGKERARESVLGGDADSYAQLVWFGQKAVELNSGSTIKIEYEPETRKFQRMFVYYDAWMKGFQFCRPILFINATFITNKYKGQFIGASTKDVNQDLYPVAYVVVDSETESNWRFFLHTPDSYETNLAKLKEEEGSTVEEFLKDIPEESWCSAFFNGERFGEMTNNLAETFNN